MENDYPELELGKSIFLTWGFFSDLGFQKNEIFRLTTYKNEIFRLRTQKNIFVRLTTRKMDYFEFEHRKMIFSHSKLQKNNLPVKKKMDFSDLYL